MTPESAHVSRCYPKLVSIICANFPRPNSVFCCCKQAIDLFHICSFAKIYVFHFRLGPAAVIAFSSQSKLLVTLDHPNLIKRRFLNQSEFLLLWECVWCCARPVFEVTSRLSWIAITFFCQPPPTMMQSGQGPLTLKTNFSRWFVHQ